MLPSNSKTSIKQLLRWGLCAVALLGGLAQAQTTRPRIPELTCTSHPAILNTAISGANGYSNSSLPINPGETDEHWDYASSRIDYPTNIGNDYPAQNMAVDQSTGPPIKNPQTDIPAADWKNAVRFDGPSVWAASPFNNAKWIGAATLPAGTTYFRYQFILNDDEAVDNFSFNFDYMIDDSLRQVFVNGVRQLPPEDTTTGISTRENYGYNFREVASMSLKKNSATQKRWVKGLNTIIFQVYNWGSAAVSDSPSGLLIQASGSSLCGSGLQVAKYMQKGAGFDTASVAPYTGTVAANQTVYYNITVSNTGNADLSGVTLTDLIPNGLSTAAGFSWQCQVKYPVPNACTLNPNTGSSLNLPTIVAGGKIALILTARVAAAPVPPIITNVVNVAPPSGVSADICKNNDGSNGCQDQAAVSTGPFISIKKTLPADQPGPFYQNDPVKFLLTVTNEGSVDIANIVLSDPLPTGLTGAVGQWECRPLPGGFGACPTPATGTISATGDFGITTAGVNGFPLRGQSAVEFTVTAIAGAVATPTDVVNTASIASAGNSAQCWNGTASSALPCTSAATVKLLPPMLVKLEKSAVPGTGSTVYEGGLIQYTVKVSNTSSTQPTSGKLADTWPAGISGPSNETCTLADADGTPAATQPASCLGGATSITLQPGQVLTYTAQGNVNTPAPTAPIDNLATWTPDDKPHTSCDAGVSFGADCTAQTSHTPSPKPVIGIAAAVQPSNNVLPGGTVSYKVTVSNNDPAAATAAVAAPNVSVLAPAQPLTGVSVPGSWACVPTTPVDYCADFVLDPSAPAGTLSGSFNVPLPYGTAVSFTATGQVASTVVQGDSVQLKAAATTAGPVHTCATGVTTETDGSCSAIATFTVATPELGIQIQAQPATGLVPGDAAAGATTFTITVTNPATKTVTMADLGIQSLLPANVTATGAPTCVAVDTSTPTVSTCPTNLAMNGQALGSNSDGVLLPGGVYTITVPAKAELAAGFGNGFNVPASVRTTNTLLAASLQCTAPSTMLSSNDGCENKTTISTVGAPVISVSNSVAPGSTAPGGSVVFTMVAKNEATSGMAISDGTFSTDTLGSANITLLGWTCKHSDTSKACPKAADSGAINQAGIALAVGEFLTYTVNAQVGTGTTVTDGLVIPVDAKFTASNATCLNSLDGKTTPCRSRAEVTVAFGASVLKITNVANPTTAAPGADVVFTIVATNTNGKPLADGVITTDTPANVSLGGWTCLASAGAVCPAASGTGAINQSGAQIPVNGLLTYTLKGKLADSGFKDGDTVVLTASIKSAATAGVTCAGGSATPCTAPAPVTVKLKPPVLAVSNRADRDTVAPGGTTTFTVVATNNSGSAITDGVLTTDGPANITLGTWSCTAASGGAVCPRSAVVAKAGGPLNLTGVSLPVGGSLTYTATGTTASTLKDGDSVTLLATLTSATAGVNCTAATPCTAPATVNIKVGAVAAVTPVPVDARWMLLALSVLLGVAAIRQQRKR